MFDAQLLLQLAGHQAWADMAHWKVLHQNSTLQEDPEIRKRLNHIVMTIRMLSGLAQGCTPDPSTLKEIESAELLEAAQQKANADLIENIKTLDLQKMIALPRGPQGPWEAPAGALLLQAITHGQHHRGQNASRIRQLGTTPPMTDFILWYALGQP